LDGTTSTQTEGTDVQRKTIGNRLLGRSVFVAVLFVGWTIGWVVLRHDRKLARRPRP
jgi:hypothetical protein